MFDVKISEDRSLEIVNTIKQYGFIDVIYKLYYQTRIFDANSYIALLNTYSEHRALPKDKW